MGCLEERFATVLSKRRGAAVKRLLCPLPVLTVSHPTGTPVLQALPLNRYTCRRPATGRRPKSSWSDTSWQAKIGCCCSVRTSDKSGRNCRGRVRVRWARRVAACDANPATRLYSVHPATIQEQLWSGSHVGIWPKSQSVQKYFWIMSKSDKAWHVGTLRRIWTLNSLYQLKNGKQSYEYLQTETMLTCLSYLSLILVQCHGFP